LTSFALLCFLGDKLEHFAKRIVLSLFHLFAILSFRKFSLFVAENDFFYYFMGYI